MRKEEVIAKIGEKNWEAFSKWMSGQTVGIYEDGETNYYTCDVNAFIIKLKTGFDRQKRPWLWD